MQQRETAVDPAGQQRRVFVIRLHDESVPLELTKVFGERQC